MYRTLALALFLASPALAQAPMTAEEFEAYVTGKTLYFSHLGVNYGVEDYRTGRRVTWSFLDGQCSDGIWYPVEDMICFDYEGDIDTQCWRFYQQGNRIRAEFASSDAEIDLYEAAESDEPMMCLGPEVGV